MERVEDGSTPNGAQIMEADGDTSDSKAVWRGQGADPQKGCGRRSLLLRMPDGKVSWWRDGFLTWQKTKSRSNGCGFRR